MKRQEILDTAKQYVTKDRAATHGDAESSFADIGAMWSIYTGANIRAHDVAAMMVLFKTVRLRGNPIHADNWIDIAGYSACGGEIATGEVDEDQPELPFAIPPAAAWIPVGDLQFITADSGERVEFYCPDDMMYKITSYSNHTREPISYPVIYGATLYRVVRN